LETRELLWTKYGVVLPGFDGDDAILALIVNGLKSKRQEYLNRKPRPVTPYG
jgi:hypothetical protein